VRPEATAVPSRAYIFFFFVTLVTLAALALSMINWGLPSNARKKLYFTS
jgi:hypothetical protein